MGTALIGLVDDIALISHPKIKKFCQKQQNQDYQVIHFIYPIKPKLNTNKQEGGYTNYS